MSSPKKISARIKHNRSISENSQTPPTGSPLSTNSKSAHRPFYRRKSSDLPSVNADLQRQVQILQAHFGAKVDEVDEANRRAQQAEAQVMRLKELARRFWKEEWSGMKDYVGLFNDGDMKRDIEEIEERVLGDYGELFGEGEGEEVVGEDSKRT